MKAIKQSNLASQENITWETGSSKARLVPDSSLFFEEGRYGVKARVQHLNFKYFGSPRFGYTKNKTLKRSRLLIFLEKELRLVSSQHFQEKYISPIFLSNCLYFLIY